MKTTVEKERPILEVLQKLSPDSSKNTLKSWVEKGRVTVNGCVVPKWHGTFKRGQEVAIGQRAAFTDRGLKILYEDAHLVVIDKPSGLLSVVTTTETPNTAHGILKQHAGRMVYPVHRLDRDTSGVMVFVYTEEARAVMKEKFIKHTIEREYYGLVEGVLKPRKGTWESLLAKDSFVETSEEGKLAITHYELVDVRKGISTVRFKLETGRKNQIRVHASEAGHPIVGDKKYGATVNRYQRLCLHAHVLGFTHPITGKPMRFTSPLPSFFTAASSKHRSH
jgi:tRNA pseudouridine32 synthase/23S rRNA pseudouridine746 synthase/23S rRNA pseudouridine1911/1915/1917 synthase